MHFYEIPKLKIFSQIRNGVNFILDFALNSRMVGNLYFELWRGVEKYFIGVSAIPIYIVLYKEVM